MKAPFFQEFLTKLFAYLPLLWMGFNFLRARATSRRQFAEIPGTDFTNLGRMKDCVDLGGLCGFEHGAPGLSIQCLNH